MKGFDYSFFADKYERKFNMAQHIAVLMSVFFWVCIPVALVLAGYYLYHNVPVEDYPEKEGFIFLAGTVIGSVYLFYRIIKYPLNLYYKNRIVKGILKEEFCDAYVHYAPGETISEQHLIETAVIGIPYTGYRGEDLFYGELSGSEYGFSEFSLIKAVETGNSSSEYVTLKGLVFCTELQMPANVDWENVHLIIAPKGNLFNPDIPEWYELFWLQDMNENVVPNDIDVYGKDTDDEKALLTAELVSLAREAFENFSYLTGGKSALVIRNGCLTFYAIHNEDLFCTSLKQMAVRQHAERDFRCIYAISSLLRGLQQHKMVGLPDNSHPVYRSDGPHALFLDQTDTTDVPFYVKPITAIYLIASIGLLSYTAYFCLFASLPIIVRQMTWILIFVSFIVLGINTSHYSRAKATSVAGVFFLLLVVSGFLLNMETSNLFGHIPLKSDYVTALIEVPEQPDSPKGAGRPTLASYMEAKEWKCVVHTETEKGSVTIYAIIPDTFRVTTYKIDTKHAGEYLQKGQLPLTIYEEKYLLRNDVVKTNLFGFIKNMDHLFGYARVIIHTDKGVFMSEGKMYRSGKFTYVVKRNGTVVKELHRGPLEDFYRISYYDSYKEYKFGRSPFKVYGDKFVFEGKQITKDMPQHAGLKNIRKLIDNDILKHRAEFAPYKAKLDSLQQRYSDRL